MLLLRRLCLVLFFLWLGLVASSSVEEKARELRELEELIEQKKNKLEELSRKEADLDTDNARVFVSLDDADVLLDDDEDDMFDGDGLRVHGTTYGHTNSKDDDELPANANGKAAGGQRQREKGAQTPRTERSKKEEEDEEEEEEEDEDDNDEDLLPWLSSINVLPSSIDSDSVVGVSSISMRLPYHRGNSRKRNRKAESGSDQDGSNGKATENKQNMEEAREYARRKKKRTADLIISARSSGMLSFYDAYSGKGLLDFHATTSTDGGSGSGDGGGGNVTITCMEARAQEGFSSSSYLYVGLSDGTGRIFSLNAWHEYTRPKPTDDLSTTETGDDVPKRVSVPKRVLRLKVILECSIPRFSAQVMMTGAAARRRARIESGAASVSEIAAAKAEAEARDVEEKKLGTDGRTIVPHAAFLYVRKQNVMVGVAYSNSELRVFTKTGGLKSRLQHTNGTISAVAIGLTHQAAFATEQGVGFTSLSRPVNLTAYFCPTQNFTNAPIVSLVYDKKLPSYLYASAADGTVLVIQSRRSQQTSCRIRSTFAVTGQSSPPAAPASSNIATSPPTASRTATQGERSGAGEEEEGEQVEQGGDEPSSSYLKNPIQLAAVKGFLIAISQTDVIVFNVTGSPIKLLNQKDLPNGEPYEGGAEGRQKRAKRFSDGNSKWAAELAALTPGPRFVLQKAIFAQPLSARARVFLTVVSPSKEESIVAVGSSTGRVTVFRAYLPHTEATNNFGMMRAPVFIVALILIAFYQYYKKKNAVPSFPDGLPPDVERMLRSKAFGLNEDGSLPPGGLPPGGLRPPERGAAGFGGSMRDSDFTSRMPGGRDFRRGASGGGFGSAAMGLNRDFGGVSGRAAGPSSKGSGAGLGF